MLPYLFSDVPLKYEQICYSEQMRNVVAIVLLSLWLSPVHAGQERVLGWAEWSVPKTAESVLAMPVLQDVMNSLQKSEHSQLRIYYPGGDEGSLWAIELRGWLVSLGLETDRIILISGSKFQDRLQFQIDE